jgi:hypothetical protein
MTPADLALDNAIHFEGVKHAYRQTKDGVVISFVVHPHDVPKGLADAPLGSRYIVALVQVGDDEQPVHQPAKESKSSELTPATPQPTPHPPAAAKRMDWRELQPAAQAGIRCADPVFRKFLDEKYRFHSENSEDAAQGVRTICGVASRSELGTKHAARILWHQLDEHFQTWKHVDA